MKYFFKKTQGPTRYLGSCFLSWNKFQLVPAQESPLLSSVELVARIGIAIRIPEPNTILISRTIEERPYAMGDSGAAEHPGRITWSAPVQILAYSRFQ